MEALTRVRLRGSEAQRPALLTNGCDYGEAQAQSSEACIDGGLSQLGKRGAGCLIGAGGIGAGAGVPCNWAGLSSPASHHILAGGLLKGAIPAQVHPVRHHNGQARGHTLVTQQVEGKGALRRLQGARVCASAGERVIGILWSAHIGKSHASIDIAILSEGEEGHCASSCTIGEHYTVIGAGHLGRDWQSAACAITIRVCDAVPAVVGVWAGACRWWVAIPQVLQRGEGRECKRAGERSSEALSERFPLLPSKSPATSDDAPGWPRPC